MLTGKGYDEMRTDFASQPKYGNNIPEVDVFVADMYKLHADTCLSLPCVYGDSLKPNAISISAHQPGGAVTRRNPGRQKGRRDPCRCCPCLRLTEPTLTARSPYFRVL